MRSMVVAAMLLAMGVSGCVSDGSNDTLFESETSVTPSFETSVWVTEGAKRPDGDGVYVVHFRVVPTRDYPSMMAAIAPGAGFSLKAPAEYIGPGAARVPINLTAEVYDFEIGFWIIQSWAASWAMTVPSEGWQPQTVPHRSGADHKVFVVVDEQGVRFQESPSLGFTAIGVDFENETTFRDGKVLVRWTATAMTDHPQYRLMTRWTAPVLLLQGPIDVTLSLKAGVPQSVTWEFQPPEDRGSSAGVTYYWDANISMNWGPWHFSLS